jgi:hypothetical protein
MKLFNILVVLNLFFINTSFANSGEKKIWKKHAKSRWHGTLSAYARGNDSVIGCARARVSAKKQSKTICSRTRKLVKTNEGGCSSTKKKRGIYTWTMLYSCVSK